MKCYKVILECFTGAKTTTYVIADNTESAEKIAINRVNNKSPNGWNVINISIENKPDDFYDNWN